MTQMSIIDWEVFESPYERVEETPKDFTLTQWEQISRDVQGKLVQGLKFLVTNVNGRTVSKELVTTSKRFINLLRPVIEVAEKSGKDEIKVRAFKSGQGMATMYNLKEL